jgi:hypothetical protein
MTQFMQRRDNACCGVPQIAAGVREAHRLVDCLAEHPIVGCIEISGRIEANFRL